MRKRARKTTKARKEACGMPCLLNVAGVCCDVYPHETTVLVHLRWLGDCGTALKPPDTQAVFGCSECNRWTDSPTPAESRDRMQYESDRNYYAARALARMRALDAA